MLCTGLFTLIGGGTNHIAMERVADVCHLRVRHPLTTVARGHQLPQSAQVAWGRPPWRLSFVARTGAT